MIIDCHCHAGIGDGFRGPWDTEARIDRHLERARAAGIDRTVVFPVFNSDYAAANARLARIVRANPGELIGFAAVNPARDAGRIATMLRRAVEDYGFCGLKIHGLFGSDGPLLHPALELYKIRLLMLPRTQEQLITGGNIARLLGLRHVYPVAASAAT